ncbi:MAG: hypothetical protein GY832_30940 [Chloroflexi bacterium]|nr:hypothetical protein [Chloroflexota bacterium]
MTYKTKDETRVEITVTADKHYTVKINEEVKMNGKGKIRKPRNQAVTWHGTRCVNYLIIDGMQLPLTASNTDDLEIELDRAKEAALTPAERIQRKIAELEARKSRLVYEQDHAHENEQYGINNHPAIDGLKAEIEELEAKLDIKTRVIGWMEKVWVDEYVWTTKTETIVTSITLHK